MRDVGIGVVNKYVLRKFLGNYFLIPLDIVPDNFVKLDQMGANFWKALLMSKNIEEAVDLLASKFEVKTNLVRKDLVQFMVNIQNANNLKMSSIAPTSLIGEANVPIKGSIELTGRCNLFCFHCYAIGERGKTGLTTERVINIIEELKNNGCLYLQLTGGECTLHPGFVEIYRYCREAGIVPTVSTNATMITADILEIFKKYPPYLIKVSLYGSDAATHEKVTRVKGSFMRTIGGVKKLKEAGMRVMFSSTLFKDTLNGRVKIKKLAKSLDVPIHFYSQLIPTLEKDIKFADKLISKAEAASIPPNEELEFNLREINNYPIGLNSYECSAGKRSFHIDAEGKLYMCKVERTKGVDITKEKFEKSWRIIGDHAAAVLKTPDPCKACSMSTNCRVCPPKLKLAKDSGLPNLYCGI